MFAHLNEYSSVSLNDIFATDFSTGSMEWLKYYPTGLGRAPGPPSSFAADFNITEGILDPFNMSDADSIKSWIQGIKKFTVHFKNLVLIKRSYHTCWNISINYEVSHFLSVFANVAPIGCSCEQLYTPEQLRAIQARIYEQKKIRSSSTLRLSNKDILIQQGKYVFTNVTVLSLALVQILLTFV